MVATETIGAEAVFSGCSESVFESKKTLLFCFHGRQRCLSGLEIGLSLLSQPLEDVVRGGDKLSQPLGGKGDAGGGVGLADAPDYVRDSEAGSTAG